MYSTIYQWQRLQVTEFCKKYGQDRELHVLPTVPEERKTLYRHLIDDPRQKFIFCFIPKVNAEKVTCDVFISLYYIIYIYIYIYNIYVYMCEYIQ